MTSTHRELRERALAANLEIPRRGLAIYTFGNVSAFDAQQGVLAIKPSGVPYGRLAADDMVVVDLEGVVEDAALVYNPDPRRPIRAGEASTRTRTRLRDGCARRAPIPIYDDPRRPLAEDVPCTEVMREECGRYERAPESDPECFRERSPAHADGPTHGLTWAD